MKRYHVRLDAVAQEQITRQMLHIAADSIDHAFAWEARVEQAILGLAYLPAHAIDEDASNRLNVKLHKYVFERNYLVHYVVDEAMATVVVVNFRHVARLPTRGEP